MKAGSVLTFRRSCRGTPDDGMPTGPGDMADPRHLRRPALCRAIGGGRGSRRIVPTSASISRLTRPRSKIRISLGGCPTIDFHGREHASLTDGERRLEAFIGGHDHRYGSVRVDPKPHHVDVVGAVGAAGSSRVGTRAGAPPK